MRGGHIRKTGMKILRSLQNIINILISSINIYFTTGTIRTSRRISVLFDKKVFSFGFIGTPLNAWLRGNMIEAHFTLTKRQTSTEKRTKPPSSPIYQLDCKTVHIFAYSSTREQSNKRSGTRLKTERRLGRDAKFFSLASLALRACETRALRAHKTLTPRFTDFFTDFEKKNRLFCSLFTN